MTRKSLLILSIVMIGMSVVSTIVGQDSRVVSAAGDKYVISAKAGAVNYLEGSIAVSRPEGRSGLLLRRDEVQVGEKISTGADGRAEILLNPGSYMRVGKNTEFSFLSTSLDDLKIRLNSGSAIFEVIAADDFKVSIVLPKGEMDLVRSGVYRVDVEADGSGTVSVWKGVALVGSEKAEVKPGKAVTVNGGSTAIAKFDRDDKDDLDIWSKDRAKELTKVNASLQRRDLRNSLVNSFNNRGWNMYDSFGLWIFSPSSSNWCFMPFGYGWGSPYGYGYGYDFFSIGMPSWIYYYPPPMHQGNPGTGTAPGMPPGSVTRDPRTNKDGSSIAGSRTPAYRKLERSEDRNGGPVVDRGLPSVRSGNRFPNSSTRSSDPSPVFIPAPPEPVFTGGRTRGGKQP